MVRPTTSVAVGIWMFTLACCFATLWLGFTVLVAKAVGGLVSLLSLFSSAASASSKVGNSDLLLALAPSAVATLASLWVLWGRKPANPGISPWWVVPPLAIAVATFAFGAYVCIDVWEVPPQPPQ